MNIDSFNRLVRRVRSLVNIDFHIKYGIDKEISLKNLRSLCCDEDLHEIILENLYDLLCGDQDEFEKLTQVQKDQIFDLDIQRFNIRLNMIRENSQ